MHLIGLFQFEDDYVLEPDYLNAEQDNQVFEKVQSAEEQLQVTQNFLKKYLYYAKKQFQPVLTDEATHYISSFWSELRQKVLHNENNASGQKVLPITIRSLSDLDPWKP